MKAKKQGAPYTRGFVKSKSSFYIGNIEGAKMMSQYRQINNDL